MLGLEVDEFYNMLPREFWNRLEGFYELENLREKNNWERTRWSTCILLNIHLGKGKRIKPTDLVKFDWDKKTNKVDLEELKNKAEYMRTLEKLKTKKDGE
jgi:hypothetical protein